MQEPGVEGCGEREVDHPVVKHSLGDELSQKDELRLDLVLVAGLAVPGKGERVQSG